MVNRNSKGHGTKRNRANRPRKAMHARRNKANARARSEARHSAIREAMAKGNA